jgi:hypothetical protein
MQILSAPLGSIGLSGLPIAGSDVCFAQRSEPSFALKPTTIR